MYYEINISKNGYHYFATAERSLGTEKKAREVLKKLLELFPEEDESFEITITKWQRVGNQLDIEKFLEE